MYMYTSLVPRQGMHYYPITHTYLWVISSVYVSLIAKAVGTTV